MRMLPFVVSIMSVFCGSGAWARAAAASARAASARLMTRRIKEGLRVRFEGRGSVPRQIWGTPGRRLTPALWPFWGARAITGDRRRTRTQCRAGRGCTPVPRIAEAAIAALRRLGPAHGVATAPEPDHAGELPLRDGARAGRQGQAPLRQRDVVVVAVIAAGLGADPLGHGMQLRLGVGDHVAENVLPEPCTHVVDVDRHGAFLRSGPACRERSPRLQGLPLLALALAASRLATPAGTKPYTSPPIEAICRTSVPVMWRTAGLAGRKTVSRPGAMAAFMPAICIS